MEQPQSFSHGLLYSISPMNFSSLHLQKEEKTDGFDWEAHESEFPSVSISEVVFSFLRKTAAACGIAKP
jgi:hypothetical protein